MSNSVHIQINLRRQVKILQCCTNTLKKEICSEFWNKFQVFWIMQPNHVPKWSKISNKSIIVTIYLWWRTFCSCCTKRIQGFMQICQHSDSCNNMHYVLYIGCNTNKVIVINNKYSCNTCMHSCWEVHQKSQKGSKDSCKYVCMHCCCKYTRSPNQVTKALCSQCTSCGSTKV